MKHPIARGLLIVGILGLAWLAGLPLIWLAILGIILYLVMLKI